MKILQINAVSGISSTGRICTEITDYLNHNGHEGFIAYSDGIPAKKGYRIGSSIDHKLHAFWSRIYGKQAYFSSRATNNLIRYIQNVKPDVVHLHNLHNNYINLKLLLDHLAVNDVPTVITLHDCWFYTGKCTHYTLDNCNKWRDKCGNCPRLKKDNPSWFFDYSSEMLADKKQGFSQIPRLAVVGVSDWITSEAQKSFLANARIVQRIYNWIDTDVFKPTDADAVRKKLNIDNKYIVLGVASGWSNAKGLDKFIEVSKILPEEIQLVLVGGLQHDITLPGNILHLPNTHSVDDLVAYYSMADVYLHLSEEETFGKVIAEAMSCGTPAIVLNSTACPEVVGNSGGIVIDRFSPDAVRQAIQIIREIPKREWREKAVRHVKENFEKNDLIMAHLELYRKIMN